MTINERNVWWRKVALIVVLLHIGGLAWAGAMGEWGIVFVLVCTGACTLCLEGAIEPWSDKNDRQV